MKELELYFAHQRGEEAGEVFMPPLSSGYWKLARKEWEPKFYTDSDIKIANTYKPPFTEFELGYTRGERSGRVLERILIARYIWDLCKCGEWCKCGLTRLSRAISSETYR